MMGEKADRLRELWEDLRDCRRCGLWESRTSVVFGAGSPEADLVFVGEAPGYHEDVQGQPFVGSAGRFLDELLAEILRIPREEVFIANVLKCRPPENRDPTGTEIETCRPFLSAQLDIIRPRTVCTLGNFATRVLTGRREGITKLRRKPLPSSGRFVFPIFHPAAALHRGDLYDAVREDFKSLRAFLDSPPPLPDAEPPQMELF
jgi:DNA polymerase